MLRLWDLNSGEPLARTRGAHQVLCVAFSPDGGTLAASRSDGAVRIHDSRTLESSVTLRSHVGEVRCLAFSPDGYTLATGGADTIVKLWDTRTSQDLLCLKGHRGVVTSLAFSADNRSLVSAALTGEIHRWSVDDLSHLHVAGFDEPASRR
jgi:WD40 repeat protein